MLTIKERSAKIGPSGNLRTEKHGENNVLALDIGLSEIAIGKEDLNGLFGNCDAFESLYDEQLDEEHPDPKFIGLAPLALTSKFENMVVSIWFGSSEKPFELKNCDVAKIKIELKEGGTSELSLQIQITAPSDKALVTFARHLNGDCRVSIEPMQSDLADAAAAA